MKRYVVTIDMAAAQLFSSDYRRYDHQRKEFRSEDEARGFIIGAYSGKKKTRIYIDGADGVACPVGWVFKYRDGDMNHEDWVQLMVVDERPLQF